MAAPLAPRPCRARPRAPRGLGPLEGALALLGLGAAVVAAFGSHVAGAPFLSDDWSNAAWAEFAAGGGPDHWLGALVERPLFGHRPLLALLLAVPHELFGAVPSAHVAWGLGLGVLAAWSLYAVLRMLELPVPHAGAIAVGWLLFPWADAVRLWATGAVNNLALALALAGLALALRALRARGWGSILLHGGATVLYAASLLTYEATAVALAGCVVLYAHRVGWRRALPRWGADLGAIALTLGLTHGGRPLRPLAEWPGRALTFADESGTLLARAAVPFGSPPRTFVLLGLAVVIGAAVLLRRAVPGPWRSPAVWALAGAGLVVAAYVPFVPAADSYHPLGPGLHNRVNLVASIGFVMLTWSGACAAVSLLAGLARRPWVAAPALAALAVAIAGAYALRVSEDSESYRHAGALQADALRPLRARASALPPGSRLYLTGAPVYAAPGVPVLRHWDLAGAVALAARDGSAGGTPLYPDARLGCRGRGIQARRAGAAPPATDSYRRARLLDARTGRVRSLRGPAECRRERRSIPPGRWLSPATLTGP